MSSQGAMNITQLPKEPVVAIMPKLPYLDDIRDGDWNACICGNFTIRDEVYILDYEGDSDSEESEESDSEESDSEESDSECPPLYSELDDQPPNFTDNFEKLKEEYEKLKEEKLKEEKANLELRELLRDNLELRELLDSSNWSITTYN